MWYDPMLCSELTSLLTYLLTYWLYLHTYLLSYLIYIHTYLLYLLLITYLSRWVNIECYAFPWRCIGRVFRDAFRDCFVFPDAPQVLLSVTLFHVACRSCILFRFSQTWTTTVVAVNISTRSDVHPHAYLNVTWTNVVANGITIVTEYRQ